MSLQREEKLEKIIQLNAILNRSNNFEKILQIILNKTVTIFDVEATSILIKDDQTDNLNFYVVTGEKKDQLSSIQLNKGEGVCGQVFQSGKPLIENNPKGSKVFSDKVDKATDFKTRNIIAVPLVVDSKRLGVLELVNKVEGDFTEVDLEFLEFVATQVSITLERAKATEEKIKSERLASIGETVAGLSHCIKNILNGLQGGAAIIERHIGSVDNKKINTGWKIVKPNIDRISDMVLSMLEYSKEREPDYRQTDVNKIITEIIELEKFNESYQSVKIDLRLDSELGSIEADPDQIYRCLMNLMTNAFDATMDSDDGRITIQTRKKGTLVVIEINDNGYGIEEENLNRLFSKFFSTKASRGTGLGLPTAHKIVTEHHGIISVKSKVNEGSTFTIKLPVLKPGL